MPNAGAAVIEKGGNKGGRPRDDGLVPGSAEAIEADRRKEAERSKRRRDDAKAVRQQSGDFKPLPPVVTSAPGAPVAPALALGSGMAVALPAWTPEDFQSLTPLTIDLLEEMFIESEVSLAEEGKLAKPTVDQIAKDAAFPAKAKQSLQSSSPEFFAKVFNALHIPIAMKPYISTGPTAIFLVVRHYQHKASIRQLIEAEAKRNGVPPQPQEKKT